MIGRRIEIREHVLADLDAYVQWQSDPEIARHIAWLPKSHAESEARSPGRHLAAERSTAGAILLCRRPRGAW